MNTPTKKEVDEFLRESNAIERVYDDDSLKQAHEAWDYLMKQKVITPQVILNTHKILMLHQPLLPNERGYFRTVDVWVGGRKGANPAQIDMLISMQFCFETMRFIPPPDWKALHVVFEKIHPFVDGNGRVGRMLMNWTRIKRCDLPILIIHAGFEQEKYYEWFK